MVNSFLYYFFQILFCIAFFIYFLYGLVAQMGDRRLGMAEAPGSNPGQSILIYLNKFIIVIKI